MTAFRALVVDDEPLALQMVAALLSQDPEVDVVATCGDPRQVVALVETHRPHVVFLDMEMPGRSGLQLAADLIDHGPVVVFITAFEQYAAKAFAVNAVDYVLKPFSDDRLREALGKAKRRVRERRLGDLAHQMASLTSELSGEISGESGDRGYLQRLALKGADRSLVLRTSEIHWIEAEDYYVLVHSSRGRHMLRLALAALEERLDPAQFVRVHRGALVNLDAIREFDEADGLALILADGARVPVSRARRRDVEARVRPRVR